MRFNLRQVLGFVLGIAASLSADQAVAASPAVCSRDAVSEVLVFEPSPGQFSLGFCDVQGSLSRSHFRALSRAELSELYLASRGKHGEETSQFFESLGISQDDLKQKTLDEDIGRQAMVFPSSKSRDSINELAEHFRTLKGSSRPVRFVEGFSSKHKLNEALLLDWFSSFQAACRASGGLWQEKRNLHMIGALVLDDDTESERAARAEDKVVCKCGGYAFSNPIDYSCDARKTPQARSVFVEKSSQRGAIGKRAATAR